jgi:hypothetical protein
MCGRGDSRGLELLQCDDGKMARERLYHRRPMNLRGNILYPLNRLKHFDGDAYEQHRAKYNGREALLEQRIPPLDCFWNDVLHLSPVHPGRVAELARGWGLGWCETEWFEFDPRALKFSAADTAVFRYTDTSISTVLPAEQFERFDVEKLCEMSEIPDRTREYYASMSRGDGRYLIFVGVPHVLHKGSLSVAGAAIVRA